MFKAISIAESSLSENTYCKLNVQYEFTLHVKCPKRLGLRMALAQRHDWRDISAGCRYNLLLLTVLGAS